MDIARVTRVSFLRPLWLGLHRLSLIGLNYWASAFGSTGEKETLAFVANRLLGANDPIIFDVGANVGEFSLACVAAFAERCTVHAFEPSRETFARLRANCDAHPGIKLHRVGLSDSEREAALYSAEPASTLASVHQLERPARPFRDQYTETIELMTIDTFCAREGIQAIDFLKLDVEGHELMVLDGAKRMLSQRAIQFIQFEFGENNVTSRTFLADFQKRLGQSYRMYQVCPGGPKPWRYEGGRSEIFATMNYLCERM